MKSNIMPALLSEEGAAAYLSISPRSFRRIVASGDIKRKTIGGCVRYLVADIDKYIEQLPSKLGRTPKGGN